jgi:hypothetical protein
MDFINDVNARCWEINHDESASAGIRVNGRVDDSVGSLDGELIRSPKRSDQLTRTSRPDSLRS